MAKQPDRKILLNPGPATTSPGVKEALITEDICPREEAFGELLKNIVSGLKQIGGGAQSYEVGLFAASGTGAVESILTSAVPDDGNVLIVKNGAYGVRMADICSSYGVAHETIHEFGDYPDSGAIRDRLQEGEFTHLAMVHHETSTGMMNPLEEISRVCSAQGVKLIVDAMSSFGGYPIDLDTSGISYLAASSNKCIHGMPGLSFVLFHRDRLPELKRGNRNFYFNLYRQWNYLNGKSQLRFTPPVQVCYAFQKAIEDTLKETVAGRWKRYRENWKILYEGIENLGFSFFLPPEQQSQILLAVNLDGQLSRGFDHFHDYLFERDITVYPGVIPETRTFRMAVIGELSGEDIRRVLTEIEHYLRS